MNTLIALNLGKAAPLREEDSAEEDNDVLRIYRQALLAFGKSAAQDSSSHSLELDQSLQELESRLDNGPSLRFVERTEKEVEARLQDWGTKAAEDTKARADAMKELVIALAQTAESVGKRDQAYSVQVYQWTEQLQQAGNLTDLTQIRSALVRHVTQLKSSVDQMTRESLQQVAHLKEQVSDYETRLKSAEDIAFKDELTGLANRRHIHNVISWHMEQNLEFSLAMLDLNRFKPINDTYGHCAGDELLKLFAKELQTKASREDKVGRWGGDEFVVVMQCDKRQARTRLDRLTDGVFGKYTLHPRPGASVEVEVEAAIGVVQWLGETPAELVAMADSTMYENKKQLAYWR